MIYSMTGYGKAEGIIGNRKVTIQLKSLNSKQADIIIKVPSLFKDQELSLRKKLSNELYRGKIELYLSCESEEESNNYIVDEAVFQKYFEQLSTLKEKNNINNGDLLGSILKMPEVLKSEEESIDEQDSKNLLNILDDAIEKISGFREEEGNALAKDLHSHITQITNLLEEALQYEDERLEIVRNRLLSNLEESKQKDKVNEDRFEQEMIYYMEKYDISEEKVRLKTHCDYFLATMEEAAGQGKKLGFISQEIGREINTLGSKANHAQMQQLVVQMKDQLEKIKEQVLNVL